MFGRLTLSLDKKKYTSKQEIHGQQKFRQVSTVLLSHAIRAQFQHWNTELRRVTICDGRITTRDSPGKSASWIIAINYGRLNERTRARIRPFSSILLITRFACVQGCWKSWLRPCSVGIRFISPLECFFQLSNDAYCIQARYRSFFYFFCFCVLSLNVFVPCCGVLVVLVEPNRFSTMI